MSAPASGVASAAEVTEATWTYPHADTPSLDRLSLQITPGEFVVLCGASGSGKSTALRLLNGLVPHFHDEGALSGEVTVQGLDTVAVELDAIGLVTGTVLQHPRRQFFTDSAPEEIAFAMENFGFPPAEIRTRVGRALARIDGFVPVGERLQRLSGGQQQQVAVVAATAHAPQMLLLDEPSANLSTDAVARLAATLAELKQRGVTIVVAEHRLRYLEELVDRVVVMRSGRIDAQWSAAEFRAVSDETLASEGLRGRVRFAEVPVLAASGRSVATTSVGTDAPESDGALVLDDVRVRFGARTVLDIDRLAIPAGSVTAFRGINGSGKSTLVRAIVGLQRASGTISLDGRVLSARARQRASAIVMQDVQRQLFTESVSAELELAAQLRDGSPPDAAELDALLRSLDLDALADRHPLSLSGGQQQRLVIAAARVAGRRVVVFDEPSSGVDRRHLQSIAEHIRAVAAEGAVVILISHDEDLLALAADQQVTLRPL
ncbi:ABC transporter ATP-binding protein [Leucobacter japonicus]|uniref:ABC transporter ATP-binding protein n=1 Tax=Leucobacter japonicus TaxID=1461259 RepID=UPI0006A7924B|nr:ABC transporter ATP-binding protein [Leucobacter japonicus]